MHIYLLFFMYVYQIVVKTLTDKYNTLLNFHKNKFSCLFNTSNLFKIVSFFILDVFYMSFNKLLISKSSLLQNFNKLLQQKTYLFIYF